MNALLCLAQAAAPAPPTDASIGGLRAILEADGLGITVTGMLIVFAALTTISLFISLLPKVLDLLEPYLPEIGAHAAAASVPASGANRDIDPRAVAAIGWALHQRDPHQRDQ